MSHDQSDKHLPRKIDLELDGVNLADDIKHLRDSLGYTSNPMEFQLPAPLNHIGAHDVTSLRKALELNRVYQSVLKEQLKRIDQARDANLELRSKLNAGHVKSAAARPKNPVLRRAPGNPFFMDAEGGVPPDNPDAVARREKSKAVPVSHKFRKWNKNELKHLAQGVQQQNQRLLLENLMDTYQRNGKALDHFTQEMDAIKNMPEEELLRNSEGIDWDVLARTQVPSRSGIDCKIQWLNNDDLKISRAAWSKDEDKRLKELASKYKGHNWEQIARELGTNRAPHQCFTRYQKRLNTAMKKSKWSDADDAILLEAVHRYGEKNWQQVASCLEGRTAQQCLHRYKKALDPSIRRGKWTPEEDRMLEKAVQAYGCRNWSKIQQHVPGRTDVQCRERWVNVLNPELNNGPWSPEEDQKLKQAIELHGLGKWAAIAQILYPRTDNQCWRRWKALNADQAEDYRNSVMKRRMGSAAPESDPKRIRAQPIVDGLAGMAELPDLPDAYGTHEIGMYEEGPASLPLVFPSSVTFTALYRLLQALEGESQRAPFPSTMCLDHVNTSEFQLLASWFNSLFLYPLLVVFAGMVQERDHADQQ